MKPARIVGLVALLSAMLFLGWAALLAVPGATPTAQAKPADPTTTPAGRQSPPKYPPGLLPQTKMMPHEMRLPGSEARRPAASPEAAQVAPREVVTNGWTNLYPDLYSINAVSAGEAWAGGEYGHLLHYSGTTWVEDDNPALRGLTIGSIDMHSDRTGWATSGDRAFYYNGTAWEEKSNGLGYYTFLQKVAYAGANKVWAISDNYYGSYGTSPLWRWDGTSWVTATLGVSNTSNIFLYDLMLTGPNDGWAVGYEYLYGDNHTRPAIFHYDGTAWTRFNSLPTNAGDIYRVWATPGGDLWVAGIAYDSYFYRYRDGGWAGWIVPEYAIIYDFFMRDADNGWAASSEGVLRWDGTTWAIEQREPFVFRIAGAGDKVWASSYADTLLERSSAGDWQQLRGGPTTTGIYSVDVIPSGKAWAVGVGGMILTNSGGSWQKLAYNPALYSNLYDIDMLSDSEGYLVGDGVIAAWNGSSWQRVASPNALMLGVKSSASGQVWAVGSNGSIWRLNGGVWSAVASPTTSYLYSVAFDTPDHGWAAGFDYAGYSYEGVLLEYTNGTWVDRTTILGYYPSALLDLAVVGPGDVWAVGQEAYHIQNGTAVNSNYYGYGMASCAAEAGGDLLAMDFYGKAARYSAGIWEYMEQPIYYRAMNGVTVNPGRGGWAVGSYGAILQYNPLYDGRRFYDVPLNHTFYTPIEYLAARGVVSGYSDNTFRPAANITRAQLAKLVVGGMAWSIITPATPTFADVTLGHPFYSFVETAAAHNTISGYSCGGPGEPCDPQNRPYFRPDRDITRGQLSKIVVTAKGWSVLTPTTPTFRDVGSADPFYGYIEQAVAKGVVGGYDCGGPNEPCPGRYFRPSGQATRGQMSKILYLALIQP